MTIIVEDGTGLSTAESYTSVAEADAYLAKYRYPAPTGWFGSLASGKLTIAVNPIADETVTVGTTVYTWKASAASAYQVTIGANHGVSRVNLSNAINASGTGFGSGTAPHPDVQSLGVQGYVITVRALTQGASANTIATTTTMTGTGNVWGSTLLAGGIDPAISTDDKESHLRVATRWVETRLRNLVDGYAVNQTQALLLPVLYLTGKNGYQLSAAETIAAVKPAVSIMALRSAEGDDLIKDVSEGSSLKAKSISAGGVSVSKTYAGSESPQKDYNLAMEILNTAFGISSGMVHRA